VLEVSEDGKTNALYCPESAHKSYSKPGELFVRLPVGVDPRSNPNSMLKRIMNCVKEKACFSPLRKLS
jgi:hypothetical protein